MSAEAWPTRDSGIEIQVATGEEAPAEDDIARWVAAVLDSVPVRHGGPEPAGPGELCVRLVDAAESAELNDRYRHRPGPTNVLSFPVELEGPDTRFWGDVVICVPLAHREAVAQGKPPAAHFTHLVVHGVLHLLGYDHESAADADQMESLERGILGRLGVADPYGEG